jgi:hypothetical protein
MLDCERALRGLASDIEPTPKQKEAASRSQINLRSLLEEGEFGRRILDAYLSGSYARDTALAPIDDVDIVIIVDPAGWERPLFSSLPEPKQILESFARAIRYRYPDSSVRLQRRSVCLTLSHLHIDVVPAVTVPGQGHRIRIPDTAAGEWITSAPRRHTEIATEINQRHSGRFKPLVKLLKYWNNALPQAAHLKSFAIETIAATLFNKVSCPSVQEGLRLFFDFLADRRNEAQLYTWPENYGIQMSFWAHELPDLAGTGTNLLAKLDADRRDKFLTYAVRSRDLMIAAEKARDSEFAMRHVRSALRRD